MVRRFAVVASERVLTASENRMLPSMFADARSAAENSAVLVRAVLAANELSRANTMLHVAHSKGMLNNVGDGSGSGGGNGAAPIHVENLHVHGVRDAQNVPAAIQGALLSQRQMARTVRQGANYGYEDD